MNGVAMRHSLTFNLHHQVAMQGSLESPAGEHHPDLATTQKSFLEEELIDLQSLSAQ